MDFLSSILGRKQYQRFFEKLYRLSLKGLNYNRASDYEGNGEAFALKTVVGILKNEPLVLMDVGANVGHFTNELKAALGAKKYTLHAFEPSQAVFQKLVANVGESDRVKFHPFGMSDQKTTAVLYSREGASGLSSLYDRDLSHRDIKLDTHEIIHLQSLDQFCADYQIARINFLKMDVEGHEIAVLKGASNLLKEKKIDIIQFEFGGCNIDSRTYFRDFYQLLAPDFRVHRILSDGLFEIKRYNEQLEVFQSANYLAISRQLVF